VATTALGAVENLQGCEYGLEIRALCADALERSGSPQAPNARQRAVDYAIALASTVRDPRLRRLFAQRPINGVLLATLPPPAASGPAVVPAKRPSSPHGGATLLGAGPQQTNSGTNQETNLSTNLPEAPEGA
jgi:hypothetical protein